jgi:hypothetical protein
MTLAKFFELFINVLPVHKASLQLTHNAHKDDYQTVEEWWSYLTRIGNFDDRDWVSPLQKQKAFITDEVWELIWYPNTPIGSQRIMAADLSAIFEYLMEIEENEEKSQTDSDDTERGSGELSESDS